MRLRISLNDAGDTMIVSVRTRQELVLDRREASELERSLRQIRLGLGGHAAGKTQGRRSLGSHLLSETSSGTESRA